MNYYNEIDPKAAAWLRQLIHENLIPAGHVDERSITEISPNELTSYTQCHFFAGIGGWSLALKLSEWPEDKPVWTGSCPCQPFSSAGKQAGASDTRHLWPYFKHLIAERQPPVVFGEQVASKLGREWLSGVRSDLEEVGYAVGGADLCAAGVGAPHIRQRLYWVANSERGGRGKSLQTNQEREVLHSSKRTESSPWTGSSREASRGGDQQWRRLEPGTSPVVDGLPARMVRLRGYGNAIVPQVAEKFIRAATNCVK